MIADWVRETTTGGAGALTTSAVTGLRRFTDCFAIGQPFVYVALTAAGLPLERGIASMSAVGTLNRLVVLGYYNGSAFVDGNTAQSLPSGTVLANSAISELGGVTGFPTFNSLATNRMTCPHPYIISGNGAGLGANTPLVLGVRLSGVLPISAFGIEVTTAGGASTDRCQVGLYGINADGSIGSLIVRSGDMRVDTTGQKSAAPSSGSSFYCPPGWYYMVLMSSIGVSLRGIQTSFLSETGPLGLSSGGLHHSAISCAAVGSGWTALPTTVTGASIQTINATFCPVGFIYY